MSRRYYVLIKSLSNESGHFHVKSKYIYHMTMWQNLRFAFCNLKLLYNSRYDYVTKILYYR